MGWSRIVNNPVTDCPTISPDCENCQCIGQALSPPPPPPSLQAPLSPCLCFFLSASVLSLCHFFSLHLSLSLCLPVSLCASLSLCLYPSIRLLSLFLSISLLLSLPHLCSSLSLYLCLLLSFSVPLPHCSSDSRLNFPVIRPFHCTVLVLTTRAVIVKTGTGLNDRWLGKRLLWVMYVYQPVQFLTQEYHALSTIDNYITCSHHHSWDQLLFPFYV